MGTKEISIPDPSGFWVAIMLIRVLPDRARLVVEQIKNQPEPMGFIFVINRREYGAGAKYKMPGGGRSNADRSPLDTAMRETLEETGIDIPRERMIFVDRLFSGGKTPGHWKYFFRGDIYEHEADRRHNRHSGNEGEETIFFTKTMLFEMARVNKLLEAHRYWLEFHRYLQKPALAA